MDLLDQTFHAKVFETQSATVPVNIGNRFKHTSFDQANVIRATESPEIVENLGTVETKHRKKCRQDNTDRCWCSAENRKPDK